MKKIGILLVCTALVLSACGKRSDETTAAQGPTGFNAQGEPIGGSTSVALGAAIGQELNVRVISSQPSLLTGDQASADITAAVTDSNNLPMADYPIEFSSTGGVLQSAPTMTDENGEASAVLSLKFDSANQEIFVKAVAGDFEGVARVVAEGSTLEVSGDENVVPGNDVIIEAKLTAGDGSAIDNELVTIASSAGNALSATSALTDPQGIVTVTAGSAIGGDTITFSALSNAAGLPTVSQAHTYTVSDDQLQFAANSPRVLGVNQAHELTVEWSMNGVPIANEDLKFSITAGQIIGASTVQTDSAGVATVSVLSTIAGEVTLFVGAPDGSVNNKHTFEFVGDTPAAIAVASTSSRVNIRDKATISSIVVDANGNPVNNTVVVFSSSNLKGGQLSSTSAVTNAAGEANITFTAGSSATEANEVEIFAEVEGTSINNGTSLTIVEPVLNVTMGTSNDVEITGANTQYAVTYVVQVADGGGQALEGAEVKISMAPVSYEKGWLVRVDDRGRSFADALIAGDEDQWSEDRWQPHPNTTITCAAEDLNGNRILDVGEDANGNGVLDLGEDINGDGVLDLGEDINGNGVLDQQDPAVLTAVTEEGLATLEGNATLTTDETGTGYFRVLYPISNATWSTINITARAQALGVEASTTSQNRLLVEASEWEASNDYPANRFSPYGTSLDCTNTL